MLSRLNEHLNGEERKKKKTKKRMLVYLTATDLNQEHSARVNIVESAVDTQ